MSAVELFRKLTALGIVLTPHGEDGLTVDAPVGVVGPALSSLLRDAKHELRQLAISEDNEARNWPLGEPFEPLPADHPLAVANEENWANIHGSCYRYLTWPRVFPNPCLCCGGRYRHSEQCERIRSAGLGVSPT